jgi:uncharacterized protein YjbI with pentapeptide repeats
MRIEPHADLLGAELSGADLRWSALRQADLRKADLRGADLRWCDLREADLRWADLRGCDLRWSDLIGADLIGADLREADLLGADLRWADLIGADLREADLLGADLRWAKGAHLLSITMHGYAVTAVWCGAEWRIRAGCRDLTVPEARAHWNPQTYKYPPDAERIALMLDWLEKQPVPEGPSEGG